jgi:predicted nucleotide-binding protein/CheY-like chemotaxis protein
MDEREPPRRLQIFYCDDQERFRTTFSERHRDRFDIVTFADIGDVFDRLRRAPSPPDLLLLDLYHPLEMEDAERRAEEAEVKLDELRNVISTVKSAVEEAWAPAAVPVLREIRQRFTSFELPVLIYTQRGLLFLDDSEIREIWECEADWLLKDERITASTEAIRIEGFVRRANAGYGPRKSRDRKRVMVVHGRNEKANEAMARFLTSMGLQPIAWEDAVKETGLGSPHNLQAVLSAMSIAQAVVILMTAEERAGLMPEFAPPGDPAKEIALEGQPRPNVFFEAGLAMGIDSTRTVLVELGPIRRASDLDGLNVVRLDNTGEKRAALRRRLVTAGCLVEDEKTAWKTAHRGGDFESCLTGLTEYPQGVS